mmetsp:Transcript_40159/g.96263  ORF Transcript_40159/g.96263 Transcript_40159/m.96263 type:complete len:162 (+) Transcript_40159:26-511(+)
MALRTDIGGNRFCDAVLEQARLDTDQYRKAQEYVEKHKLEQLFKSLLAYIIKEQPSDPDRRPNSQRATKEFLVALLKERVAEPRATRLGIMTEENLVTMFNMLDVHKKGVIGRTQMEWALRAIQRPEAIETRLEDFEDADLGTFLRIVRPEVEAYFAVPRG